MTPLVNLLPWRRRERRRQLRYWLLLSAGCLTSAIFAGVCRPALFAWQMEQQHINSEYLAVLNASLQRRYQQALEQEKARKIQAERDAERQMIQAWDARLTALAGLLPDTVWLTSLSVRSGQMVINGKAESTLDVQALEHSLRQLEGISGVKAEGLERDAKGQLSFIFTLALTGVSDVA